MTRRDMVVNGSPYLAAALACTSAVTPSLPMASLIDYVVISLQ